MRTVSSLKVLLSSILPYIISPNTLITSTGCLGFMKLPGNRSLFFFFFLFYDNFTYMSNMFFQLLAWESMG